MVGPRGGIYVDVGSNIGNHAVFFGRFCAGHVVAIEPNPRLHAVLTRNIESNGLAAKTTIVPVGISDVDAIGAMTLRDEHQENIGASHIVPGAQPADGAEPVTLRRLDGVLDDLDGSLPPLPITLLKIDVEGMEMGVLRSAVQLLRRHRPQIFVELITREAVTDASAFLAEFGYVCVNSLGSPPSYHFVVPGRHALRENRWRGGNHHAHSRITAEQELASVTPADAVLVVADLDQAGFGPLIAGRPRLPFIERGGQYFGPPASDADAMRELARLDAQGATHFVLAWPAFWFSDVYSRFEHHLRRTCLRVMENTRIVVFDLRQPPSASRLSTWP
jgi:FkbM family methyltransferase